MLTIICFCVLIFTSLVGIYTLAEWATDKIFEEKTAIPAMCVLAADGNGERLEWMIRRLQRSQRLPSIQAPPELPILLLNRGLTAEGLEIARKLNKETSVKLFTSHELEEFFSHNEKPQNIT